MKLTYEIFRNHPVFIGAIQKVYTCAKYPSFKSTHRIKRLCDSLETEMKTFHSMLRDISKSDLDEEAKKEKLSELTNQEFEVKWEPLTEEEVEAIGSLSPAELAIIEKISDPSVFES